jgi:hypothetical protein
MYISHGLQCESISHTTTCILPCPPPPSKRLERAVVSPTHTRHSRFLTQPLACVWSPVPAGWFFGVPTGWKWAAWVCYTRYTWVQLHSHTAHAHTRKRIHAHADKTRLGDLKPRQTCRGHRQRHTHTHTRTYTHTHTLTKTHTRAHRYEALMINEFSHRPFGHAVLKRWDMTNFRAWWCVCVSVCVFVCVCMCVCTCALRVGLKRWDMTNFRAWWCVCVYTYVCCVCMYVYTGMYVCVYVCVYARVRCAWGSSGGT